MEEFAGVGVGVALAGGAGDAKVELLAGFGEEVVGIVAAVGADLVFCGIDLWRVERLAGEGRERAGDAVCGGVRGCGDADGGDVGDPAGGAGGA